MRYPVTKLVAGIVALEAVAVMAGWILHIDRLTRLIPVGINMKFMTAVLFLFGALALYFIFRVVEDGNEMALVLLPGISLVIFLITVTLVVSRLVGTPTGLEELFLHPSDPVIFPGTLSREGWPSFLTLINFVLLGVVGIISLFPGYFRKKFLIGAGYFILITGVLACVGYAFNLPVFYYQFTTSSIPMAVNTALAFAFLGFGLTRLSWSENRP